MTDGDWRLPVSVLNQRLSDAQLLRAHVLEHARQLAVSNRRQEVIPYLIAQMVEHKEVERVRLWQVDVLMWGVSKESALKTVRKAKDLCGESGGVHAGHTTLGWALASEEDSQRFVAWLWCMLLRERLASASSVPKGFPYSVLFVQEGLV